MSNRAMKRQALNGFTLVELAVVITVIGILATITVFSIGNWRERTAKNEVQSDLIAVSTAMENAKNFNNGYPLTLPTSFTASPNVTVTLKTVTATSYCIEASSRAITSVLYSVRSSNTTPAVNGC